ncbi:MAG: Kelch repeat-containing protein [Thermoplasmatota archaeon]
MGVRKALLTALALAIVLAGCTEPASEPAPTTSADPAAIAAVEDTEAMAAHPVFELFWEELEPLPAPVHGAACTVHRGELWLLGGIGANGVTQSRVDHYSLLAQQWSRGIPLGEPRHHAAAYSDGDAVSIAGGYTDRNGADMGATADVSQLAGIGFWVPGPELPEPRAGASVVLLDGRPVVVGGGPGEHLDVLAMDEPFGWNFVGQLHEPRVGAAALIHEDGLVAVGGDAAGSVESIDLYVGKMDNSGASLSRREAMPTAREGFAWATSGPLAYILGGQTTEGAITAASHMFNVQDGRWWHIPEAPAPFADACAVSVGDGVHVLGGLDVNGAASDRHWVLTWDRGENARR